MYRFLIAIVFACLAFQSPVFAQEKGKTFLSGLKVGQAVQLKEADGRYSLTLLEDLPLRGIGFKVLEIGSDYIVVEDASGITELRIPLHSIKTIIKIKTPK